MAHHVPPPVRAPFPATHGAGLRVHHSNLSAFSRPAAPSFPGREREDSVGSRSKRLQSKADPTLAMNEAEPAAVAAGVESSLAPLRSIQHRDALGNLIAEPDRSNPTRSRWERPLDTIRSFEAAVDGAYQPRGAFSQTESDLTTMRPRSYHQPRFPHDSYSYANRLSVQRTESRLDTGRQREREYYREHAQGGYGAPAAASYYTTGPRHRPARPSADTGAPAHLNAQPQANTGIYPLSNHPRSYETVTSGGSGTSGSGGSTGIEPSGYTTDPTSGSDSNSVDRAGSPLKRLEPGPDGAPPSDPALPGPSLGLSYGRGPRLAPNPQQAASPKAPIEEVQATRGSRLFGKRREASTAASQRRPSSDKRRSWFSRRFSRQ